MGLQDLIELKIEFDEIGTARRFAYGIRLDGKDGSAGRSASAQYTHFVPRG